jgi:hypothetical protein
MNSATRGKSLGGKFADMYSSRYVLGRAAYLSPGPYPFSLLAYVQTFNDDISVYSPGASCFLHISP